MCFCPEKLSLSALKPMGSNKLPQDYQISRSLIALWLAHFLFHFTLHTKNPHGKKRLLVAGGGITKPLDGVTLH